MEVDNSRQSERKTLDERNRMTDLERLRHSCAHVMATAILRLWPDAQFAAGPTSALTWALYGDVADYGEWKFGRRSTGLVYSASLFAIKTGLLVGGFLLPLFLDRFGFVRNAAQTATALLGITLAFSIAPGLFALLKAGALLIYPLDQKRVDAIEQELASRRAAEPKLA